MFVFLVPSMAGILGVLRAGGQAAAFREQERQLRSNAARKAKIFQAAIRGDATVKEAAELLACIHKVP